MAGGGWAGGGDRGELINFKIGRLRVFLPRKARFLKIRCNFIIENSEINFALLFSYLPTMQGVR